ncbi:MAG TPA: hypothetical protein DDW52_02995 [Planctomycetaceae bacterium]|nr:hypothetical protein [Planctomycetaceae bacterium]
MSNQIAVFSDLDGCLLDKQTYSFAPAVGTLKRLREAKIPVILASSKTEPEMLQLAEQMALADAPLICENGGTIRWTRRTELSTEESSASELRTILGHPREQILSTLASLKDRFDFRSFVDLGVSGVAKATSLPDDKAALACTRASTEPLLWEDDDSKLPEFQSAIEAAELTLTRGGRFWHVSGRTTKGLAMQAVVAKCYAGFRTIAIGDSPIDQSLLDVADYPIGIPAPDGTRLVKVSATGRFAESPGPDGWDAEVSRAVDSLSG